MATFARTAFWFRRASILSLECRRQVASIHSVEGLNTLDESWRHQILIIAMNIVLAALDESRCFCVAEYDEFVPISGKNLLVNVAVACRFESFLSLVPRAQASRSGLC